MIQFLRLCRVFLCISMLLPALLWADPPLVEAFGNTLSVESSGNAPSTFFPTSLWPNPPFVESSSNTPSTQAVVSPPEVVITANRLDTPASEVASSLTVITAKDLERKQSSTMLDALKGVPGVDLTQTGGPGQIATLFMRGGSSENTLIMMDGIPLNDPIGAPFSYDYLDQLSLGDVKQVEVVRGPQSALYGSNAMAGVVNIITQEEKGPLGASLSFEGGSYGTFRESATAGGGDESGSFSLTASRLDTAGFPNLVGGTVNNGDQNYTTSLKMTSTLAPNFTEDFLARYSQSHTSLDAYDPYSFLLTDDPSYFADQNQLLVGSRSRWSVDTTWEQVLGVSFVDDNRSYNAAPNSYNSYYDQGQYDGQEAQVDWQNNLHLSKEETLVAGFQGQEQWGSSTDSNNGYGQYDGLGNAMTVTDTVNNVNAQMGSLFVSSQTNLEDRFFINAGGRLDEHSQFGSYATWQVGLAYFIPGVETKLKANCGTGFVAPSLYQLYDPTYGKPGLQPETSTGFDAGFEQPIGQKFLRIGATYFHNDFNNLIDFDSTFHYANISQAQSSGWETFLSAQPLKGLKLQANYTYTWAFDAQTGQELLRRPQNKAGMDVFYSLGPTEWGSSIIYVGDRLDYGPVFLPGYFLVNLRGSLSLDEHLKLFTRIDNLFNETYQEAFSYATPGFSIFAGTKVSL